MLLRFCHSFTRELNSYDKAIHIESESADRRHSVKLDQQPRHDDPMSEIDFVLQPFNRKDRYLITIYVMSDKGARYLSNIEVSSEAAVKFVAMPTFSERLMLASREILPIAYKGVIFPGVTIESRPRNC